MNKTIWSLVAVAVLGASAAQADVGMVTAAQMTKEVDEIYYVETSQPGIVLSGYVDVGYIYNFTGSGSTVTNRFGQDGTTRGDFNVNAVKLALEKGLTDENTLQAGFRVDLMIGEDATGLGGNFGSAPESALLQQAYVQFRLPYGNGIDIKAGRFVTWLGYEVMERPANLNITYGNLFQNMTPLHHLGVSAEYKFSDLVDGGFAVVNGYNSDDNNGLFGNNTGDGYGIMAKLNVKNPGGNANLHQAVYYSWDSSNEVVGGENGNVVIYDVWGQWEPVFADGKLLLAFNADLGYGELSTEPVTGTTWWGAALYAKYKFTDIFSLAARADYIHTDDGGTFFTNGNKFGIPDFGNEDLWSWTLTAGFDLLENFTIRGEYRVDFGNGTTTTGADGVHTLAAQAVYSF